MKRSVDAIEGIGPVRRDRLAGIHIKTVGDLLSIGSTQAGRLEIAEAVGVNDDMVLGWVRCADLMRIPETGTQYSDLLVATNVVSIFDLADRDPETLHARLRSTNKAEKRVRDLPSEEDVRHWILQAQRLKAGLPLEARLDAPEPTPEPAAETTVPVTVPDVTPDTVATPVAAIAEEDDAELFDKFDDDFSLVKLSDEAPDTNTAELIAFAEAKEQAMIEAVEVKSDLPEIEAIEVETPDVTAPQVVDVDVLETPEFDLAVETPTLDAVEIEMPTVDVSAEMPALDLTEVKAELETPAVVADVEVPAVSVETPDVAVETPDVAVELPDVAIETPDIKAELAASLPASELEMPDFGTDAQVASKKDLSLEALETLADKTSSAELDLDDLHAPDIGADTGDLKPPNFEDFVQTTKKIKPAELVDDNPRFVAPEEPEPVETSQMVEQVLKKNTKKKSSKGISSLVMWLLAIGLGIVGCLFVVLGYALYAGLF